MDLVNKVERCRDAILEGLRVEFAQMMPPLMGVGGRFNPPPHYNQMPHPHQFPHYSTRGRGRGPSNNCNSARLYARGGQLQVAGVVVGSWGPNYGTNSSYSDKRYYSNGGYPDFERSRGYFRGGMPNRNRMDNRYIPRSNNRGRPSLLVRKF